MDRYINEALKVYEQRQKSYLNKAERGGNAAGALNQGQTIKTPPGNKQFFATIQGKQVKASPYQIREWNKNTTEEQRNDPNYFPEFAKTIISQGGKSTASIMREQGKVWNQKLRRYVDAPKKTEAPKTTTSASTKPKTEPGKTTVGSNTGKKVWNPKTNTYDTVKETPKTKPKTTTPKAKPAAKPKTNTKKETPAAKPEAKPKTKPATGGFVTEDMLKSQPTIKALQIRNERLYATGEITKSDYLLTRLRIERVAKRFQYEERLRDDSDPIKPVEPKNTGEGSNYVGSHGRKLGGRKEALAAAATGKETTNRGVKRRNNSSGPGLSIADRLQRDKE